VRQRTGVTKLRSLYPDPEEQARTPPAAIAGDHAREILDKAARLVKETPYGENLTQYGMEIRLYQVMT
jgi:hypothetical protein